MDFSLEYSCKISVLPNETFMEEIKPVVTEKAEFQHREDSSIIPYIEIFGLSRVSYRQQNYFCQKNGFPLVENFRMIPS